MKRSETVRQLSDELAAHQLDALVEMASAPMKAGAPTGAQVKQLGEILTWGGVGTAGFLSLSLLRLQPEDVLGAYALVDEAVASYLDGGWRPPDTLDGVGIYVMRFDDGRGRRFFTGVRPAEWHWRPILVLMISSLLERAGEHLRRCPEPCRRVFVRRGRRDYCSPACSQRARSARHYRARRETILARRADAYARAKRPARVQPRRATLQRLATEVGTGRSKTPQVAVTANKNARQSTRGKSGR